jgi:asparagine synthase (glutamine-hydrolysing)
VGLEARSPFLDEELLAYSAGLAPLLLARGTSLKWIAKRALSSLVPREIAQRTKRGFGAPVGRWFRGRSPELREALLSPNAKVASHFDADALRSVVDAHAEGREEAGILLWRLLALEEWLRWVSSATSQTLASSNGVAGRTAP